MGSGFKKNGEKNEEGEVKCGNLEKNYQMDETPLFMDEFDSRNCK